MPKLIPQEKFEELTLLAFALIDGARAAAQETGEFPAGAQADQVAAAVEVQAFSASMMALANACPLMPTPLFIAMGSAIGVILAQQVDPHAVLLGAMRDQTKASYNDIVAAHAPQGNA